MASRILDLIPQLLAGSLKQSTLTALNTYEAIRYSLSLSLDIPPGAKLIVTTASARHLLETGHLTGHGTNHRLDSNPLSLQDLKALPKVFKNPDKISFYGVGKIGYRVKVEKRLSNYYRLILDVNLQGDKFTIVTYFNTNKKPLD